MFDFIPLENYYKFYLNLSLLIVIITLLHALLLQINDTKNIKYINTLGYLFFGFSVLYIGLRPVSGVYFGDMATYNRIFTQYANGAPVTEIKDVTFQYFMKFCSQIMTVKMFFTICAFLYIYPLFRISIVLFQKYWFYSFLMLVVSMSFWAYGTNGIRNGLATSIFLWGISYYDRKITMALLIILSIQLHQTLILPSITFVLTFFHKNTKNYLLFWVLCIPLSIALGGFWENLFASLGFGDDRLNAYLIGGSDSSEFSSVGFRYDFLVYSAGAVFVGWYFIYKKSYQDIIYKHLYHTYLVCNGFWILIIRASFSNRFAYLSWFMMALIIIYPYLKGLTLKNHYITLIKVLILYFLFTYLMEYVYYAK